jgi:hypothetical protein
VTSRYWLVSGLVSVFVPKVSRWRGAWRWRTWAFATQHVRFCALPLAALLLRLPSSASFLQLCFSRFLSTYFLRVVFHAFGCDLGFFWFLVAVAVIAFPLTMAFEKIKVENPIVEMDGTFIFPLFFVALQLSLYQRVHRIIVLCRGIFWRFLSHRRWTRLED